MGETKDITRNVRMTPTVYNYVLRMDGKSFNDKFNKMVAFCMTREKLLHDQVKELEKQKFILETEILRQQNFLEDIDVIKQLSVEMIKQIRGI